MEVGAKGHEALGRRVARVHLRVPKHAVSIVPKCMAVGGTCPAQSCLGSSMLRPRHGGLVAGRAGGDITSNGPKCGNTVNKVYFTFNFDI